jgi:hypothetical protein
MRPDKSWFPLGNLGASLLCGASHAGLALTMIKDSLTSSFLRYAKPIG